MAGSQFLVRSWTVSGRAPPALRFSVARLYSPAFVSRLQRGLPNPLRSFGHAVTIPRAKGHKKRSAAFHEVKGFREGAALPPFGMSS